MYLPKVPVRTLYKGEWYIVLLIFCHSEGLLLAYQHSHKSKGRQWPVTGCIFPGLNRQEFARLYARLNGTKSPLSSLGKVVCL